MTGVQKCALPIFLLLFLGFGFTIIFSIQLIVVQAIIRMVDDAYKYATSEEEEIENKK